MYSKVARTWNTTLPWLCVACDKCACPLPLAGTLNYFHQFHVCVPQKQNRNSVLKVSPVRGPLGCNLAVFLEPGKPGVPDWSKYER